MEYDQFLEERRNRIAQVIRDGYESLTQQDSVKA